jgi:hypothetical protein
MQFGPIRIEQDLEAPDNVGDVDCERSCDSAAIKFQDCLAQV